MADIICHMLGLYVTEDPGGVDDAAKIGQLSIRLGLGTVIYQLECDNLLTLVLDLYLYRRMGQISFVRHWTMSCNEIS